MKHGLHAAITPLQRIPPQSVDPTVKNYHWLDLVKGLYAAYEAGAETAMLVDAKGNVSEGPGFNIFAVTDGTVLTPEYGVLSGITRQTIFEICHTLGVLCSTGDLSPTMLKAANEVFVTSTAGGVMPVTKIDADTIGLSSPGPLTKQITERYWQMHRDDKHRLVVEYPAKE